MRAIIRIVIEDSTDEQALELKKKVAKLLEFIEGAKVELVLMG